MQALGKPPGVELGWRSRGRWQWLLMAIAVALLGLPERVLAQAYRAAPETMQIEDQPGYVPDPEAERLPAIYQRQMVFYRTTEAPGTIIVQTSERYLYVVQPNSRAIRYGIGVGRDGFQWSGLLKITRKAEWPDWNPPPEMIARQPYLPRFMAGGPGNPLSENRGAVGLDMLVDPFGRPYKVIEQVQAGAGCSSDVFFSIRREGRFSGKMASSRPAEPAACRDHCGHDAGDQLVAKA